MRVIVESPYAGNTERNIRYLRACLRDCVERGESPYASHGLLTQEGVLDDNIPEQRELGVKLGLKWLSAAHKVVVYSDLGVSRGMEQGMAAARDAGVPVERRRLGDLWDSHPAQPTTTTATGANQSDAEYAHSQKMEFMREYFVRSGARNESNYAYVINDAEELWLRLNILNAEFLESDGRKK